jgi:NADPH-dependent glutamate synthase beta subunit-like oxidoreductase
MGHEVEIHEAGPMAGGMMRFGIPAYRVRRDILDAEVKARQDIGVTLRLDTKVEDVLATKEEGGFDAVFMAVGAHLAKKIDIPAREAGKILDAVSYLASVEAGEAPKLGRRVAIYGGGNTAMDAARTAKRLGAEEFQVEVMEIDENGRPQPTGEIETLEVDSLVLALGQNVDTTILESIPGVELDWDGVVEVGSNMMTGATGIFAGGDMVPSERTVTIATGHGKKAAHHIDAWLRGEEYFKASKEPSVDFIDAWLRGEEYFKASKEPSVDFSALHLWYHSDAQQRQQTEIPAAQRNHDFREVTAGLSKEEVLFESSRCYSCGNCFECDGCFGACPESAIIKLGKGLRYEIDYDICTGCEACFLQCPCHAMEMVDAGSKQ